MSGSLPCVGVGDGELSDEKGNLGTRSVDSLCDGTLDDERANLWPSLCDDVVDVGIATRGSHDEVACSQRGSHDVVGCGESCAKRLR